jgi:hypothetical protein
MEYLKLVSKNGSDIAHYFVDEIIEALEDKTAENAELRAELNALKGIHPASERPSDQRDIILIVDGEERRGWCGKTTGYYYQIVDPDYAVDDFVVTPTAWKELPDD